MTNTIGSQSTETQKLNQLRRRARAYLFGSAVSLSLLLVVAAGAVLLGIYTLDQHRIASFRLSHQLADGSKTALQEGDATLATLLALEGLPNPNEEFLERPFVPEAEAALFASLSQMTERRSYEGSLDHGAKEDAKFFALRNDDTISVVDVAAGTTLFSTEVNPEQHIDAALSHDGRQLALLQKNGTLRIYDVASGEEVHDARIEGEIDRGRIFFIDVTGLLGIRTIRGEEKAEQRIYDVARPGWLELENDFSRYTRHIETVEHEGKRWMILIGPNKTIGVVDVAERKLQLEVPGPFSRRSTFAFSEDFRWFAAAQSARENWRALRKIQRDPETGEVKEEDRLYTPITLVDLELGAIAGKLSGHFGGVTSMDIDSAKQRIVSISRGAGTDQTLNLWDLETKGIIGQAKPEKAYSDSFVRIIPRSGDVLLISSNYSVFYDEELNVEKEWLDVTDGRVLAASEIRGPGEPTIVQGSKGHVIFFNRWRARQAPVLKLGKTSVRVDSYPELDRHLFYSHSEPTVIVTDGRGTVLARLGGHQKGVRHVHYLGDSGSYVTVDGTRTIKVWNSSRQYNAWPLSDEGRSIGSTMAFAPDDSAFAIKTYAPYADTKSSFLSYARADGWNSKTMDVLREKETSRLKFVGDADRAIGYSRKEGQFLDFNLVTGAAEPIGQVAASRIIDFWPTRGGDDLFVLAYSRDEKRYRLLVLNKNSQQFEEILSSERRRGVKLAVSNDHQRVAVVNENKAMLWDPDSQRLIQITQEGDRRPIRSIAFNPTGNLIGIHNGSGIAIWDIARAQFLESNLPRYGFPFSGAFAFDPTSNGIFVPTDNDFAGQSGIKLLSIETGDVLQQFLGLDDEVREVRVTSDGRYILGRTRKRGAVLWDREAGLQLVRWPDARHAEFSPGGSLVLIQSGRASTIIPILPRGDALVDLARKSLPPHRQGLTTDEKKRYHLTQ